MAEDNATVRVRFLPDGASLVKLKEALAKAVDLSKTGKGLKIQADSGSLNKLTSDVSKALTKAVGKPLTPIIKPKVEASGINSLQNAMAGMSRAFAGMGAMYMGNKIGGGIKNFITDLATAGFELEKYSLNMQTMLKSTEMGKGVFMELMQLSTKMPGTVLDLIPAYNQLVNLGLAPTRDEMYKLGEVASMNGKSIQDIAMTIQMASGGTFKRMRSMGIEVKKTGDTLKVAYRGQTKEIGTTKQAIYDYMVSLGEMDGVQGAMAKQMDTLAGQTQNISDQFAIIKLQLYLALERAFLPFLKFVSKVVEKMSEWIKKHPKLTQAILIAVIALGALLAITLLTIGAVIGLALFMQALTVVTSGTTVAFFGLELTLAPLILIILAVIAVIVLLVGTLVLLYVYWDEVSTFMVELWNDVVDAFQNGVDYVAMMILDWVTWMYDTFGGFTDYIVGAVGFMVGIFTMNLPLVIASFNTMVKGAADALGSLEKFSYDVASAIMGFFAKAFAWVGSEARKLKGVADKLGLGWVADGIITLADKGSSTFSYHQSKLQGLSNAKGQEIAKSVQAKKDNVAGMKQKLQKGIVQRKENATKREKTSKEGLKKRQAERDKKDNAFKDADFMSKIRALLGIKDPNDLGDTPNTGGGNTGGGNTGGGASKGTNKGSGTKAKSALGKDDKVDKASIVAITGMQKVLQDMGYSLESEIRRADLFKAQREALKAIEAERRKQELSPFISFYNNITNKNKVETPVATNQPVNIIINGSHGVNGDTKVKDLIKIAHNR